MDFKLLKGYAEKIRKILIFTILGVLGMVAGLSLLKFYGILNIHWLWVVSPIWICGLIGIFYAVRDYWLG